MSRDPRAIQRDSAHQMLTRLDNRVEQVVEDVFGEISREFIRHLSGRVTAAGEPIDESDFTILRQLWVTHLPRILGAIRRVFQAGFDAMVGRFGTDTTSEPALTAMQSIVDDYLNTAGNRLVNVGDSLWDRARTALAAGVRVGEDYDDLRRRLMDEFARDGSPLGDSRARTIARTEVAAAWNQGALMSARLLDSEDRPLFKTWLATVDQRTRECHWQVDGATVALDGEFVVCGVPMDGPHDPSAPADQTVNCRCTVTFGDDSETPSDEGRQFLSPQEIQDVEDWFEEQGIVRESVTAGAEMRNTPNPTVFDKTRQVYSRKIYLPRSTVRADATMEPDMIIHSARIRGATLVDIPAFTEVKVEIRGEPDDQGLVPVGGVIAAEDVGTGDGRMQSLDSFRWEGESWPLRWDREDTGFHEGAILVGRIDVLERVDNLIHWSGVIDLNVPEGNQVAGIIHRGMPVGISVDLDDIPVDEIEFRESPDGLVAAVVGDIELPINDNRDREWDGPAAASRVLDWATNNDGDVDADRLGQAFLWRDDDANPATLAAYKLGFADVVDGRLEMIARGVFAAAGALEGSRGGVDIPTEDADRVRARVSGLYARLADHFDDPDIRAPWDPVQDENGEDIILMSIEASAWAEFQAMPEMPAKWFAEPTPDELPTDYGPVHYQDGRIFGWVAQAGVCHQGDAFSNTCLTVDDDLKNLDFSTFNRSPVKLDDGSTVAAGVFTMNTGHDNDGADVHSVKSLFDNTRTVAGIVTVGRNERGVWFSGAAAPWLSEWDRQVFAACAPSYHVRQERSGRYSLLAVLSVPVPGHPTRLDPSRIAASSYTMRNRDRMVASVVERSNSVLAPVSAETRMVDYRLLAAAVVDEMDSRQRARDAVAAMRDSVQSARKDLVSSMVARFDKYRGGGK